MKFVKTLFGLAAATGLGALIGVLYAPKKGSETRKDLTKKQKEYEKKLKKEYNKTIDKVSDEVKKADKKVSETTGAVQEELKDKKF